MNLTKKITQILLLLFLVIPLFSCQEGCIEADQFDSSSIKINSLPDNIYGSYDPVNGGQRVDWTEYGLKTNGKPFLMQISGTWMSLDGGTTAKESDLQILPICNTCAKKNGVDNCICYKNQIPAPELDISGRPYTKAADGITDLDCENNPDHQDDAVRCSCTKQHGNATDYGVYHFPLDIKNKDETVKLADEQNNCRYVKGMGAYVALWGSRGVTTPIRAYHIFSEEEVCSITRNSNGQCIDSKGKDMTRYVYRSPNNLNFMKDDNDGNDDIDNDTSDDIYHSPNEVFKAVMYDQYYRDNYGYYNVQIFGGVGSENEPGLLEFLVSLIEEKLLGEKNEYGKREGGIIRSLYNAVVSDSGFKSLVQITLILYIAVFGAAHIWGLAEMNKKEIFSRALKIALVMFFITPASWEFYNMFVVGFFLDAMNYMLGFMLSLSDANIEKTSLIVVAQEISGGLYTEEMSSRFAYPDLMIRNLMSDAAAKKIIGLFFADFFGWFYIIMIYVLIFMFIAMMLFIATIYTMIMMKIIFVLAIGPIFILFSLFSKTKGYFVNWLSFLAGKAFEAIFLFLILYLFLSIIDKNFTEMLLFRTCAEKWGIGPLRMTILKADINRSLLEWLIFFVTIPGLLFVMYQVVDKVPSVVGAMFSLNIGGTKGGGGFGDDYKSYGKSSPFVGTVAATGMVTATLAGKEVYNRALTPLGRGAISAATSLGRATGFNQAYDKYLGGGLAGIYRNSVMRNELAAAMKAHPNNEAAARSAFNKAMDQKIAEQPGKMMAAGINQANMEKFLDNKLIKEPMQNAIRSAAKEMRSLPASQMPIGNKAVSDFMNSKMSAWAKENLSPQSQKKIGDILKDKDIQNLMLAKGSLSGSEAATIFSGNQQLEDKFRQHLADRKFDEKQKADSAWKNPITEGIGRAGSNAYQGIANDPHRNPNRGLSSFERGLERQKNNESLFSRLKSGVNPFKPKTSLANVAKELAKESDFLDRNFVRRNEIDKLAADSRSKTMRDYLQKNQGKIDTDLLDKKSKKDAEKENQKREFFRDELRKSAIQFAGGSPDRAKRDEIIKSLDKNDGKSLFEKATALDHLNKHLDLNSNESAVARLSNLLKLESKRAAAAARLGDKKAEKRLRKLEKGIFGQEIDEKVAKKFAEMEMERKQQYSDPLLRKSDKEIDALIEENRKETARQIMSVEAFRDKDKGEENEKIIKGSKDPIDSKEEESKKIQQEIVKESNESLKQINKLVEEVGKEIAPVIEKIEKKEPLQTEEIDKAKFVIFKSAQDLIEKNPGIIPSGLDFESLFGKGAAGALLQAGDIIPKAGSIIPGGLDQEKVKAMSDTEINKMKLSLNMANGQIKLAKMAVQIEELELEQMKIKGEDAAKIAAQQSKISDLKKELDNQERNFSSIEKTLEEGLKG